MHTLGQAPDPLRGPIGFVDRLTLLTLRSAAVTIAVGIMGVVASLLSCALDSGLGRR